MAPDPPSSPATPPAPPDLRILPDSSALASLVHLEASGLFGAFEYDIPTRTLRCSAEMFRRHGLDPENPALQFDDLWQRILPADRERVGQAALEGLTSGHFSTVYRVQLPAAPLRWIQATAHLLRSPQQTPLKWTGIVLDASSTLVAETLQQEARDQVVELVESIAESFIALDCNFRFTYVNQRVCEKTGKSREELIGRSLWDIFPEAAASEFYAGYQKVAKERVRNTFLVPYAQPGGSHAWFEAHAFPTAEGLAALIRDVTELKNAREALEASEERFRRAQQAANIGAFEWNLTTNQLTWAAKVPTFSDVADTADFAAYLNYVDPSDRPGILAAVERILTGGQHSIEVRVHPPDGRELWFYLRGEAAFDAFSMASKIYGVAMDVTERKHAEAALRTSEKLAATGRLAATIAHEINNPLEAVTNLLFLAAESSDPGSPQRDYLAKAESELQRVAAIVRQTLGFYRGTTSPARIDLAAVVREALALFEKRFASRNIALIPEDIGSACILAVEGEIRQIVTNLVANAMDAVEPGGSVRIRLVQDGHSVRLEVRDTGRGIPASVMARLFEPFFTTKSGTGTGLGLWVSRELARKNGGSVEAVSPGEGQGSTFSLVLPAS